MLPHMQMQLHTSLMSPVAVPAAHVPLFLYPFLNTTSKTRPFEYLRLTSLGVIGALVKVTACLASHVLQLPAVRVQHTAAQSPSAAGDFTCGSAALAGSASSPPAALDPCGTRAQVDDTEVINFLLSTEIIPLCLRTMEMGSELSKTVATFIVQKILLDDVGLNYICATAERFFAVGAVLGNMVRSASPSCGLQKQACPSAVCESSPVSCIPREGLVLVKVSSLCSSTAALYIFTCQSHMHMPFFIRMCKLPAWHCLFQSNPGRMWTIVSM